MRSALTKLMDEIHFNIPMEVLNLAFSNDSYRHAVTTIDDTISTEVIKKRLLVDLNLSSQESVTVPLTGCQLVFHDTIKTAFYIPKELTEGRSIVSVHNMLSGFHLHGDSLLTNNKLTGSTMLDNSTHIMNSLDNVNIRQTSRIDLIGENTILIDEGMLENLAINVTVILENEENLNNINPRSFKTLSHLAVLITKSYIYNKMIVKLNSGQIMAGHDLSIIKETIERYDSAEEEYQEYYNTVWKVTAFTNNNKMMDKYVSSLFGNTI